MKAGFEGRLDSSFVAKRLHRIRDGSGVARLAVLMLTQGSSVVCHFKEPQVPYASFAVPILANFPGIKLQKSKD